MSDIISINKSNFQIISEASQMLIPWWGFNSKDILKSQTEDDPKSYLDSYYLFPLNEISVNSDCDDIPKFINERFQNILSATNHSGLSVLLLISSKNGKNEVFLGFKNDSSTDHNPELFESIINGILPGKNIKLNEMKNISSLVDGYKYGGIVTGVPTIKKDDEKQKFNLASVTRSLYGKDYTLAIISKPVSEIEKQKSFNELIQLRDNLHALAIQTVGDEKGTSTSVSESENRTTGSSNTSGRSVSKTFGAGISIFSKLFSGTYSCNHSKTDNKSTTKGKTETSTEQQSRSISIEQQNGIALELEKIADQYIERMIQGFNSGYWETTITFASQDKITSDILGGTFAGELSKPNDKLLPPPRVYSDNLETKKTLFIPKISSSNTIFPKSLSSYITSEELSLIASPPIESIPGYEIQRMPALALTDNSNYFGMILGSIADHGNPIKNAHISLSKNDLNKHLFVCGLTGSGKTTTVKHILKNLVEKEDIPFLVLESAKRDYRQLLADDTFKENLNIFTIGDATISPIRFNPFYIQEGVHPLVHIDYLKAIFNASFSLYGPMPSIVEKCLHAVYIKKGWDLTTGIHPHFLNSKKEYDEGKYNYPEHYYCFPTLTDLKNEIDRYIKTELDYKGELRDNIRTAIIVRIESLCVGAKGLMFNTHDFFTIDKLLSKNTILEMENLADDDDKAFFVGLILVLISEYRQKENPAVNPGISNKGLRHFMVIEEAHRLLKNVETERTSEMMGNPKGKAVEVFCNVISEMRSLGQGVAVVEQIPSKIAPDVIKNSNTKIVHRLVAKDDQSLLAGSLSIDDSEALYLNRLNTGHALCHKEGMGRPVECVISNDVKSHAISDERICRLMNSTSNETLHPYQAYQLDTLIGSAGTELIVRLFNSLVISEVNILSLLQSAFDEEMKKLIVINNINTQFDEAIFRDYFTLKVMVLINSGIYCRHNSIPAEFKFNLSEVIKNPSEENKGKLIKSLNILWKPLKPMCFIEEVVENLTIQRLLKNKLDHSHKEIAKTVSSFFLQPNNDTTIKISDKVVSKLEAYHV